MDSLLFGSNETGRGEYADYRFLKTQEFREALEANHALAVQAAVSVGEELRKTTLARRPYEDIDLEDYVEYIKDALNIKTWTCMKCLRANRWEFSIIPDDLRLIMTCGYPDCDYKMANLQVGDCTDFEGWVEANRGQY